MKKKLEEELLKQIKLIKYDRSNTIYENKKNLDEVIKKTLSEQKKTPTFLLDPPKTMPSDRLGTGGSFERQQKAMNPVPKKLLKDPPFVIPKVELDPIVSPLFDTWFGTSKERQKLFGDWLIKKGIKFKNPNSPTLDELRYYFWQNNNKLGEEYFLTLDKKEQERWKKWKEVDLPKLQEYYRKYGLEVILGDLTNLDFNSDSQQVSMFRGGGLSYILNNLTDFVAQKFEKLNTNFWKEDKAISDNITAISDAAAVDLGYNALGGELSNVKIFGDGIFLDLNSYSPFSLVSQNTNTPIGFGGGVNPTGIDLPNLGLSFSLFSNKTITYPDGTSWKKDAKGVWTQIASSKPLFDPNKRDIMKWVESRIDEFTPGSIQDFIRVFGDSFELFLSARTYRDGIAKQMGWTSSPSTFILKDSNMDELGNLSRATAVDTSFIVGVTVINLLQEIFSEYIKRAYDISLKAKKDLSNMGADEKSQYVFDNLFSFPGILETESRNKYDQLYHLVENINKLNEQILLQTPERELNPGHPDPDKVSNLQACNKAGTVNLPQGAVSYRYSMMDVCKNYGGLWVEGPTSSKRCCCATVPKEKTVVSIYPKTAFMSRFSPMGDIITDKVGIFFQVDIDLTKSCESVKDVRTTGEKINDTINGCKNDYHCWLDIASVVSLVIPGYGLIISFVVDTINAGAYLVEAGLAKSSDDRNSALMGAGFSMLGALMGGGGGSTIRLMKGYPPAVKAFGKDFSGMVYDIYGHSGYKELGKVEKEEIEGAFEMLVRKHGLSEAEQKLAKNYLEQVKNLDPSYLQKYTNTLEEIRDNIGLANFQKIGSEKGFIKILGAEQGDVLKALGKYSKTAAGKEFLQELGLFTLFTYKMPEWMQGIMVYSAKTGKRPVIGGNTSLATLVQVANYDLKEAQEDFGSDRSAKDNEMMRQAWLAGWRPKFNILTIDEKDFRKQYNLFRDGFKIKYIKPQFIQNKNFGKFATATLKKRLVDEMMNKIESDEKKEFEKNERITIEFVDDGKFGEKTRYSPHTIVPKKVKQAGERGQQQKDVSDPKFDDEINNAVRKKKQ